MILVFHHLTFAIIFCIVIINNLCLLHVHFFPSLGDKQKRMVMDEATVGNHHSQENIRQDKSSSKMPCVVVLLAISLVILTICHLHEGRLLFFLTCFVTFDVSSCTLMTMSFFNNVRKYSSEIPCFVIP